MLAECCTDLTFKVHCLEFMVTIKIIIPIINGKTIPELQWSINITNRMIMVDHYYKFQPKDITPTVSFTRSQY